MSILSRLGITAKNFGACSGPENWNKTTDQGEIASINPATGETIASVYICSTDDYEKVRIEIRNFGVIEVKPTKAKPNARNPQTNEEIFVPAHKKTHFKPGKILKQYLSRPIK